MASPIQDEVHRLEAEMQRYVVAMQFEEAARVRDRLKVLKAQLGGIEEQVAGLEAMIQRHVAVLEFEEAAQLRDQIRVLRSTGPTSGVSSEERLRTVFVGPLPREMKEAELLRAFPAAVNVTVRTGKSNGYAFVLFPTLAEAEAAAARGQVDLAGHRAFVSASGDKKREAEVAALRTAESRRTVVLGKVPLSVSQADLQECFPTAGRVMLTTKDTHACAFVVLPTVEEAVALAQQAKIKVAEHILKIRMHECRVAAQDGRKRPSDAPSTKAKRHKP